MRKLKYLGLERLKGLRDDALTALIRACGPTLEDILLDNMAGVGDASLEAIAAHCPALKHICLHGLRGVSEAAIQALYALPKLPAAGGVHVLPPEPEEGGEGGPPPGGGALFSLDDDL